MKNVTKHFILPIIVFIVGGLVLQFLTPLDLPEIYHFIVNTMAPFLFTCVELPIWKIIFIFLVGPLIIFLCLFLRSRRKTSSYYNYKSDKIYGLLWDWSNWRGVIPRSQALTPRCPKFGCKCQLRPENLYGDVTFYCQHCGFKKIPVWLHNIIRKSR